MFGGFLFFYEVLMLIDASLASGLIVIGFRGEFYLVLNCIYG